jgi:hypothetical protein
MSGSAFALGRMANTFVRAVEALPGPGDNANFVRIEKLNSEDQPH